MPRDGSWEDLQHPLAQDRACRENASGRWRPQALNLETVLERISDGQTSGSVKMRDGLGEADGDAALADLEDHVLQLMTLRENHAARTERKMRSRDAASTSV